MTMMPPVRVERVFVPLNSILIDVFILSVDSYKNVAAIISCYSYSFYYYINRDILLSS